MSRSCWRGAPRHASSLLDSSRRTIAARPPTRTLASQHLHLRARCACCLHQRCITRRRFATRMQPCGTREAAPAPALDEETTVFADAPPPPASGPRWRRRLYAALHTKRAHALAVAIILADVMLNLAGLLVELFSCKHGTRGSAARALEALRWTSVALLSLMLCELAARALASGPVRFFRVPLHAADAAVLVSLLSIEAAVSDRAAEDALGLLVVLRLARVLRLLGSMQEYAAGERDAAKARLKALQARVLELESLPKRRLTALREAHAAQPP